jgi:hypothetical protein
MSVTVKFSPTANSQQAAIIPNATEHNDGVMSAAQAAALSGLVADPTLLAKLSTLVAPVEVLQASGAIGLTQFLTTLVAFAPLAMTLAPGFDTQQKWLTVGFGGPAVITPVGGFTTGQTTLTLAVMGDYAILGYFGPLSKWGVFITNGVLI